MTPDTIIQGDCLKTMRAADAGSIDLVFADPPYNIGYVYDRYRDDRSDDDYVAWCTDWMREIHRLLTPTGAFWLAIGDEFAAELCVAAKRAVGFHLRNWVIWHYSFGQHMKRKFSRAHTHLLYFTRSDKNFTFNDLLLRFPSARHTEYQDLRANADGRLPDDVWNDVPRLCGTFKEREGYHGCQLPEALLTRIILACSHPGQTVLDPFVGSGTTAVVAKKLDRRYVGIDMSADYVKRVRGRLAAAKPEINRPDINPAAPPELHREILFQIYRETNVARDNLLPNRVAMEVIARSLSRRTGTEYSVEHVATALQSGLLPKLANDRPFATRNHVTSEGKKYIRTVKRWQPRKRSGRAVADTPGNP